MRQDSYPKSIFLCAKAWHALPHDHALMKRWATRSGYVERHGDDVIPARLPYTRAHHMNEDKSLEQFTCAFTSEVFTDGFEVDERYLQMLHESGKMKQNVQHKKPLG